VPAMHAIEIADRQDTSAHNLWYDGRSRHMNIGRLRMSGEDLGR